MSVFESFDPFNILYLDIETAPVVGDFEELGDELQDLWAHKCKGLFKQAELQQDDIAYAFGERAGIYAEFGKIICISVGFMTRQPGSNEPVLRLKSFTNHVEGALLDDFTDLLNKHFNNPEKFAVCGHNIREFDIPYICRRMLVNQMPLPRVLDIAGKKPWEVKHLLDTLEMWKFGDIKNYTSLRLLCALFGIPSPKDDISGADVGKVYWEDRDLDRIAKYCEKDVAATVQLFLKMRRMPILRPDQIFSVRS